MGSSCSSDQRKKDKDGKSKSSKKGKKGVDKSPRGSTASNSSLYVYQKAPTPPPEREGSSAVSSTGQGDTQPLLTATNEEKHSAAQRVDSQPLSPTSPNQIAQSPKDKDIPPYADFPEASRTLLLGNVKNVVPPLKPKKIIIFLCADRKDTETERTALMGRVYKKLRENCATRGYELDVLDMQWGLEGFDDHILRDVSLYELKRCSEQQYLFIPVVFLNETLGPELLPQEISSGDWDSLQEKLNLEDMKQLFQHLYILDENSASKCYKLSLDSFLPQLKKPEMQTEKLLDVLQSNFLNDQRGRKFISYVEKLLMELKTINEQHLKRSILIMRRFIQRPQQITQELEQNPSQQWLVDLQTHFLNQVDEGHALRFTLHWKDEKVDPDDLPEHAQYLDDLCAQFQQTIMGIVDSYIESTESKGPDAGYLGMDKRTYCELLQQFDECKREYKHSVGQEELISKIGIYVKGSRNKPLVIHGAQGSGKSTLIAKAIQKCSEWLPNAPIVFRFVGLTPHSSTTEQILRSICEQCCLLYGVHQSLASQNIVRLQEQLSILLQKVSPSRSMVVFIDGLDQMQSYGSASFNWIPLSLPDHVKLILSFRDPSPQLQELKALINDDSCFIEIPNNSVDQCMEIVQQILQQANRTISQLQETAFRSSFEKCPVALYAAIIATQACWWTSEKDVGELLMGNLDEQILCLFKTLEQTLGLKALQRIFGYLTCVKQGIMDSEMNDLLSCDGATAAIWQKSCNEDFYRVSSVVWTTVKRYISRLVRTVIVNHHEVTRWWNTALSTVSKQQYLTGDDLVNCSSSLVDYYQCRWAETKCTGHAAGRDIDCLILPQMIQFGHMYNHRKLEELSFQLHSSGRSMDEVSPWEPEWVLAKLCGSDVYNFLEDLTLFEMTPDLELLQKFLETSAYALAYDGTQLYTQVVGRLVPPDPHEHPQMHKMYELSCHAPIPSLLPLEICLRPLDTVEENNDKEIYFDSLHFLKNSTTHAASLAGDSGEIVVWSIYEQKAVRKLTGLDQPRNIKMVDENRGLVLCNRELKLYNLDEASFEVKLKGVMNQKMPYYGLHDADHVVSLSRNRMYVHMTTLQAGEQVANFKVGEDRFLNSLLVSANGKMCVCGDETQKPFPLLVWDLDSRKLVYDLRIPHHEFVTSLAAITNDGHYVVSVCKEVDFPSPNFIIVYDLQSGTLFKKWKPDVNTCSIAISSEGGCVVSGLEDTSLLVWDLVTGACRFSLMGHCAPPDNIRLNECGDVAITYDSTGQDRSIRVWNIAKGHSVAVFTPDSFVKYCELSPDGGAIVIGLQGRKEILTLVLCNQQTVSDRVPEVPLFGNVENTGKVAEVKDNV